MTRIHILGGTGYAGGHLAHTAAARGHDVVSFSRTIPQDASPDVTYRTGDVLNDDLLSVAFDDADVVISALSARGPLANSATFAALIRKATDLAVERGTRFGVIGGAGSLRTGPDGPLLVEAPGFPAVARPEALVMTQVLDQLRAIQDDRLDWFFVSPAANFGAQAPGQATGHYRIGGDVILFDENGNSEISGEDLALAITEEIETPTHHRQRFTVAY